MENIDVLEYNENKCCIVINKETDFQNDIMIKNKEDHMIFKLVSKISLFSFTLSLHR